MKSIFKKLGKIIKNQSKIISNVIPEIKLTKSVIKNIKKLTRVNK